MSKTTVGYYEQPALWERDRAEGPVGRIRLAETISLIPPSARSVLDVGCGNGFLVNTLQAEHSDRFDRIAGLDSSEEALKHVRSEKFKGSASFLPFERDTFDLVTALEVLEHLLEPDFQKALAEIQRVAGKYIIVSVPNGQDLLRTLIMCPKCRCCFNPSFHVRSFDKSQFTNLFPEFMLVELKEVGPLKMVHTYSPFVTRAWLAYKLFVRGTRPPPYAVCPQCGCQTHPAPSDISYGLPRSGLCRLLSVAEHILNMIARRKPMRSHLLALYAKKDSVSRIDRVRA